ncbi:hypothetical protein TrVGV298_009057 [Trichoderma virens]|nr:hypothetical protein TrVGV298_009057 [Trichoderma virens]
MTPVQAGVGAHPAFRGAGGSRASSGAMRDTSGLREGAARRGGRESITSWYQFSEVADISLGLSGIDQYGTGLDAIWHIYPLPPGSWSPISVSSFSLVQALLIELPPVRPPYPCVVRRARLIGITK